MLALLLLLPGQAETVPISKTEFSIELVRVADGKLGSKKLKPFWLARRETTYEAFEEYFQDRKLTKVDGVTRPSSPYEPPNGKMGVGKHPAVGMRWHGAAGFCDWLTRRTGQKFRLPTEAEWEVASRGGSNAVAPAPPDDVAWHAANSSGKTHVVGGKKPNAFGLHDMMGNVWEHCLEPHVPATFNPVVRGGAWDTPLAELRFAHRQTLRPEWYKRDPNIPRSLWWLTDARVVGFRVARMGEAADQKAQTAYLKQVKVEDVKQGEGKRGFMPVSGRVVNGGDRTLWEVEVTAFFLDPREKPLFEDLKGRPSFNKTYPVLANSWHGGSRAAPLKSGESRAFSLLVPQVFDFYEFDEKAAAHVSGVRFAK